MKAVQSLQLCGKKYYHNKQTLIMNFCVRDNTGTSALELVPPHDWPLATPPKHHYWGVLEYAAAPSGEFASDASSRCTSEAEARNERSIGSCCDVGTGKDGEALLPVPVPVSVFV